MEGICAKRGERSKGFQTASKRFRGLLPLQGTDTVCGWPENGRKKWERKEIVRKEVTFLYLVVKEKVKGKGK